MTHAAASSQIESALGACPLFTRVSPAGWRKILEMARPRAWRKGASIFRQGDPCPGIHVVAKGLVRLFILAPTGKEHVLHLVGPGETFAEVAAIGGFPCPASAEAVEPAAGVLLPADLFNRALRDDHDLCLQLMVGLALRVRHLLGLLEDIVFRDAAGRLARYMLERTKGAAGELALPSLKRHLASHLDFTSETLSRTLRRLIDAGLIEPLGARRLRVLDPGGLRRLAQGGFPGAP